MSKKINCYENLEEFMSNMGGIGVKEAIEKLRQVGIEEAQNFVFNHNGFAFIQNPKVARKVCEMLELYPIFYAIEVDKDTEDVEFTYSTLPNQSATDGYLLCERNSPAICILM